MAALAYTHFTPEEYLAIEREAEYRSEYINGQIIAMAGASRNHNRITTNLTRLLDAQLLNQPCDVFATDMRVKVREDEFYTYPDLVIVCGEAEYESNTLLNPTVLIEVLSPSTANFDRGAKFESYRRLTALQEYILIAQDHVLLEHYVRRDSGWLYTDAHDLADVERLPSIDCMLPLAEVYRRVAFDAAHETSPDSLGS